MIRSKKDIQDFVKDNYALELKCINVEEFDEEKKHYVDISMTKTRTAYKGKYVWYTLQDPSNIEYELIHTSKDFIGLDELITELKDLELREIAGWVEVEPVKPLKDYALFKIEPYYVQGVPSY